MNNTEHTSGDISKCPFMSPSEPQSRHTANGALSNKDWWPNQLNLGILHQNSKKSNPLEEDFDYKKEFLSLDLKAVKADLVELMTDSQDWWPADYGHYGPFFVRMAWHSAGTYRATDGRGGSSDGTLRFAPLNSWPDNGNLDKARRLLWPIKQKYGQKLSWADLLILTGNVAIESMGLETIGFAGGREDVWEPQEDVFWGDETEWLGVNRYDEDGKLNSPLAAAHMGLIYVNPEGVNGVPEPMASAAHIRETFGLMSMNDEETVALIAGGHTFGKGHGAADPEKYHGPEPEGAPLEEMGLGWKNSYKSGKGADTITSGLEGAWNTTPTEWNNGYFNNLFGYEWELTKSPAGAHQWKPKGDAGAGTVPDAHDPSVSHAPIMFTTDLALITDPEYLKISKRFHENPAEFSEAFQKAWHKLTHRDLGPVTRGLGEEVAEAQLWQDPVPAVEGDVIGDVCVNKLKELIAASDLTISEMVKTAWASASTFRNSDKRGGGNGARIRLAPQKDWAVNEPEALAATLAKLEAIQQAFNAEGGRQVSMADLIILAGSFAIELAAKNAGQEVEVPFTAGRADTTQELTDVESFAFLEPKNDGFRNYLGTNLDRPAPENLLDRAQLLDLTAPEMTALVGGMRVLNTTVGYPMLGLLTDTPEQLTNDFFKNLTSMDTEWKVSDKCEHFYEGTNAGEVKWYATSVDLVFGANSQLRAISEVYASDDGKDRFIKDFIAAWTKVMNADLF